MFEMDGQTAEYILLHGGSAVIDLKFQGSAGDVFLAGRHLLGSTLPAIRLGEPSADAGPYVLARVNGSLIYHAPGVKPKPGRTAIRIVQKSLLGLSWLELEGARYSPVFAE